MASRCEICSRKIRTNVKTFLGKLTNGLVPEVCSWDCLAKYIDNRRNSQRKDIVDVWVNKMKRNFISELEQIVYNNLSTYGYTILYEPFILKHKIKKTYYIPDFFIMEKMLFIEVKGVSDRISKVKLFGSCAPLIMLPAHMIQIWEGGYIYDHGSEAVE